MQIVIDIPNGAYEELCNAQFPVQDAYRIVAWIKNGTPLPKGHGRIVDIDNVVKDLESFCESFWTFNARGHKPNVDYVGEVLIEADKEVDE